MNRIVAINNTSLKAHSLPPIHREGPARVLFLSPFTLGWKTFAQELEHHAARRSDIDAVHVRLVPPSWMRLLNHRVPLTARDHLVHPIDTWRWAVQNWLGHLIRQRYFDIIHCGTQHVGLGIVDLKPEGMFKLSVSLDSTEPLYIRDLKNSSVRPNPRVVEAEKRVLEAADLIVPFSHWSAQSVREDYGILSERIHVSPPVITISDKTVSRDSPSNSRELVRVVFIGNDFERKGGPMLVRWHQERWADVAELHICSSKAKPMGFTRNIRWHGGVPHERLVAEILPKMNLFVLPTQCDWSSFATVEAQTLGIPSVVSRMGGISDLLADGKSGFLIDPTDEAGFIEKIDLLIRDPDLRQRMSAAACEFAGNNLNASKLYNGIFDRMMGLLPTAQGAKRSPQACNSKPCERQAS